MRLIFFAIAKIGQPRGDIPESFANLFLPPIFADYGSVSWFLCFLASSYVDGLGDLFMGVFRPRL